MNTMLDDFDGITVKKLEKIALAFNFKYDQEVLENMIKTASSNGSSVSFADFTVLMSKLKIAE